MGFKLGLFRMRFRGGPINRMRCDSLSNASGIQDIGFCLFGVVEIVKIINMVVNNINGLLPQCGQSHG